MMFAHGLVERTSALIDLCRSRKLMLATAESCTGGLIASLITSVSGSSDVFEAGFVTYSNAAKTNMIGVPVGLITSAGAVSEQVARAMAAGALTHSGADLAVAVTGIAGPGGGSSAKPVGLVHCAVACRSGASSHRRLQLGDIGREAVRLATVEVAIEMLHALALAEP
jgi:nicotinamide-nucleotide amidase